MEHSSNNKKPRMPQSWRKLFRALPGYDPIGTAEPGDWFDAHDADKACAFFPQHLTHVEGKLAHKPFNLEPWQRAIIGCLFGWKRRHHAGTVIRRYQTAFILVGKKNGKTPLCAGICNYVLFCDHEPGAQIYSAACEREQAALLYRHARGMVEASPELSARAKIYAGTGHRSIALKSDTASSYRVVSADADSKDGFNPHLIVVDEIHRFKSRDLVDCLTAGFVSENRLQPLLIYITTADWMRDSICNEKHDYAESVRSGRIKDSRLLPVLFQAGVDDNWKSVKTWRKANPNLGVSVSLEQLKQKCIEAQEVPALENTFRRLHLNQRTEQDVRWVSMDAWDACGSPVGNLANRVCCAGVDLSATSDLTCCVLVYPPGDDGMWDVVPYFWVPETTAAIRDRTAVTPYKTWARQGFMELTPGNTIDYNLIRTRMGIIAKTHVVREVSIDRLFQGLQLATELIEDGFNVIDFGQGFLSMAAPCKLLTELILSGKIRHGGHPVLRWCVSNVATETDAAGNIKFSKKKSCDKIDGAVAMAMGVGRAMAACDSGSVYDNSGMVML